MPGCRPEVGVPSERVWAVVVVYCLLALVVSAASLAAPLQEEPERPTRTAVVTTVTEPILLDGVLDEPAWQSSPGIGVLVQRIPTEGAEPSERTEVTLLRDEDNLYIGVMCHDSEPDRILASQMARDASLGPDDYVELLLDTFRDQSNAFYFSTNPNGALVDGLVFANGETNEDWDAIWNVATQRSDQGWSAEFAIPFKSLNFPPDGTVWGFNISRNIQRKFEEARWAGARFDAQFFQVSEAGEITGMGGLEQGLSLDIRPFVAGRWDHRAGSGEDSLRGKPGLDLFYNVTPNLKLTATFNTDFGETEVDARQINLTRFSIFFPEKRSFFLQDAGVFNFATTGVSQPGGIPSTGAEIFPFFSRRIGLLGGREVPLDYGVKLTGRVGRTEVGVLNVSSTSRACSSGACGRTFGSSPTSERSSPAATPLFLLTRPPWAWICAWPRPTCWAAAGTSSSTPGDSRATTRASRTTMRPSASPPRFRTTGTTPRCSGARSRRTSIPRSGSFSAATYRCCGSAPASTRGRRTSGWASSRCTTTSSTRSSPGSTTAWSKAGTSTSRSSTGISSRAIRCTACST
ncbi:MAG: carbohydrate binding family 9 domain-containing protein [Acidobacteria bacterium]|nr:carbohydrate binding family 9 domain-containing protein [Acidobacteriota bacterium]